MYDIDIVHSKGSAALMAIFNRLFGGEMTQDDFAKQVISAIRQAGETREISYDPAQFRISPAGEEYPITNLHNFYKEYQTVERPQRDNVIRNVVRGWFAAKKEMPESFEDAGHDLLPSVRTRSYLEFFRLQSALEGKPAPAIPHQVIGDHLALSLVYDLPESMRMISDKDLEEWGVTLDDALDLALENLSQLPAQVAELPGGAHIFASGDSYDAARMIHVELIKQLEVSGDPVVMLPTRDYLLVAGTGSGEGLATMATIAAEALERPRPITGLAFRLEDDRWLPWLPPAEDPLYPQFKELQLQSLGRDYAEQKELLDSLHTQRGEDVFVASFSGLRDAAGNVRSYSLWSNGISTLLPKTDAVAFLRDGGDPLMVAWDRVFDLLCRLMTPQGLYPERYRVDGYPTPDELAALSE